MRLIRSLAIGATALATRTADGRRTAHHPGRVPPLDSRGTGCPFADRCPRRSAKCEDMPPLADTGDTLVACWHPVSGDRDE